MIQICDFKIEHGAALDQADSRSCLHIDLRPVQSLESVIIKNNRPAKVYKLCSCFLSFMECLLRCVFQTSEHYG